MSHSDVNADYLVGSVVSSWNSFRVTGPVQVTRAEQCFVWDSLGRQRIDWIMGWGSLLLGHNPPEIKAGVLEAFDCGFGMMYETPQSAKLAELICEFVPPAEKVRFANSGTEATLHALRIARAWTKRDLIVKFEGHFHGLNDYLLYGVDGSPAMGELRHDGTIEPIPGSLGLPDHQLSELLLVVPFNDEAAVQRVFDCYASRIAAVILEPIALNIGCVAPNSGFLQFLREICTSNGAVLIFDEILTGFRVGPGGAQAHFSVSPDLTCLGKGLGCGMPIAAICGTRSIMEVLSPVGPVEMAGTNTGRLMTVCGTIAALTTLKAKDGWRGLWTANDRFVNGARQVFSRWGVPAYIEGWGGRIGIHIGSEERPHDFRAVCSAWNKSYHEECYRKAHDVGFFGFLLPLGPCPEPVTISLCHTDSIIDESLDRLEAIVKTTPYHASSK